MLMSADGKISTGVGVERDFDKDLPNIKGASDGLQQYYDLEMLTDLFSFNTGKVMAKVGWNEEKGDIERLPVSFIIVDNKPHLTKRGVSNLLKRTKKLYIASTNNQHPAKTNTDANLEFIYIDDKVDFTDLFKQLRSKASVDRLTIQSGGEMNSQLIREGLVNNVSVVVTPILVGGKDTPTLVDGPSLITGADLRFVKPLELVKAAVLKNSYLHLQYKVL